MTALGHTPGVALGSIGDVALGVQPIQHFAGVPFQALVVPCSENMVRHNRARTISSTLSAS
jgi:hypothetical protein